MKKTQKLFDHLWNLVMMKIYFNAHMIYGSTVDAQSDSFHSITEINYLG
jgi:hypothetical protein